MEKEFWFKMWENNYIGFHKLETNLLLVNNIDSLQLKENSRIFIPLCGKTLDIKWLLSKGFKIVGCELVEMAIKQLFNELQIVPEVYNIGKIKHYKSENIDIFVSDILDISKDLIGNIDAIYDRAAMVALPDDIRRKYTKQIQYITNKAPIFLIVFEYNEKNIEGPPFAISKEEIELHYGEFYNIKLLEKRENNYGFKPGTTATEFVWFLSKK